MKIKKGHSNWLMNNIINLMQLHIYELVRYISQAVRIDRSYKQSCKYIQAVFEPRDVLTTSSVLREDARTATASNMNITANGSSSWNCYSLINQVVQKHVPTVASGLILVVSLIGNSLIVTIVFKTPTLKKPINFMIVNMAISDLLFPVFLFPLNLVDMQADPSLIGDSLHQTLCKIGLFLLNVSATVSIQSLILITVDRFGAVVMPIRGSPLNGRRLCRFFIVVTWIVAVAANSPYLFAFKFVEYPGETVLTCVIEKSSANYYIVANFIAFFYIPFVLLIILYAIILIKLKQHAHPGEQTANAAEMRSRRNRNVLKMAIVIVFVFLLCWIPYITNQTIFHFAPNSSIWSSCNFFLYDFFTSFMAAANCTVNPIICLIFSSNYRQGLKRLVTFCA